MKLLISLLVVFVIGCTRGESKSNNGESSSASKSIFISSDLPSFLDIQLGAEISILKDNKGLASCQESDGVDPDDTKAGIKMFNCASVNESIKKAKLTFFKSKLFSAEYFVVSKDETQEKMRRAFIQKFGKPDEDISNKKLTTDQYPAEAFAIPRSFNSAGVFEKWKKSNWRAYTASFKEQMFFIKFIDTDANDELVKILKKIESEKSEKDLKDLKI